MEKRLLSLSTAPICLPPLPPLRLPPPVRVPPAAMPWRYVTPFIHQASLDAVQGRACALGSADLNSTQHVAGGWRAWPYRVPPFLNPSASTMPPRLHMSAPLTTGTNSSRASREWSTAGCGSGWGSGHTSSAITMSPGTFNAGAADACDGDSRHVPPPLRPCPQLPHLRRRAPDIDESLARRPHGSKAAGWPPPATMQLQDDSTRDTASHVGGAQGGAPTCQRGRSTVPSTTDAVAKRPPAGGVVKKALAACRRGCGKSFSSPSGTFRVGLGGRVRHTPSASERGMGCDQGRVHDLGQLVRDRGAWTGGAGRPTLSSDFTSSRPLCAGRLARSASRRLVHNDEAMYNGARRCVTNLRSPAGYT